MSRNSMKSFFLGIADVVSFVWRLIPEKLRQRLFFAMLVIESRDKDVTDGLRRLFVLKDQLDLVINERAMLYGQGEHPKHFMTNYHQFFIDHISQSQGVLDIGCGYGAVAKSIANALPDSQVLGVDYDQAKLAQALKNDRPENLNFHHGDATKDLPEGNWDVVVLSNVLEHIVDRVEFLKSISSTVAPKRVLIRVPLFERDWQMPMRRAVGANYYSDSDHKIEHTLEEFSNEMNQAGLKIKSVSTLWGEIWADCEPTAANS